MSLNQLEGRFALLLPSQGGSHSRATAPLTWSVPLFARALALWRWQHEGQLERDHVHLLHPSVPWQLLQQALQLLALVLPMSPSDHPPPRTSVHPGVGAGGGVGVVGAGGGVGLGPGIGPKPSMVPLLVFTSKVTLTPFAN